MPEIRQSLATKEWVIIATERAKRPHEFVRQTHQLTAIRPEWQDSCPFCPGNEEPKPMELLRMPAEGPWQVRVVQNRYPALDPDGDRARCFDGIHRVLSGVGRHEIIIESRRHNTCLALMTPDEAASVINTFLARGRAFHIDPRIEQVVYFENHGLRAGTSIDHPHAQMVGLPVVPHNVRERMEEAQRHFDDTGHCVFCDMWQDEVNDGDRVILQDRYFVAFVPFAAMSPFHAWIVPKRHAASFLDIAPAEVDSLGYMLHELLRRLYVGLCDPDYNFVIRSAPVREREQEYLHWYVSVIPRVTESAGFEMGSGMYINTALPEESAAFLRSLRSPA